MRKLEISTNRYDAEEVMGFLTTLEGADVHIDDKQKSLDGALDALVIVANLSTVATNAFLVWLGARAALKSSTSVRDVTAEENGDTSGSGERDT